MKSMHDDRELVKRLGDNSRQRAINDFNVKPISECWVNFYKEIL